MVLPLFILLGVFFISMPLVKAAKGAYDLGLSARLGLSAMLIFTGLSHFLFPEKLMAMIPDTLPGKNIIVYATGVFELLGAIGIHIKKLRKVVAWLLIIYFLAILPANIYFTSQFAKVADATDVQKGYGYLWYRIPLQIYFILFTYFSSIWKKRSQ